MSDEITETECPSGYIDQIKDAAIQGWALDNSAPGATEVDISIEGEPIGTALAGTLRFDLADAGIGDGYHGFALEIPRNLRFCRDAKVVARCRTNGKELIGSGRSVGSLLADQSLLFDQLGQRVVSCGGHDQHEGLRKAAPFAAWPDLAQIDLNRFGFGTDVVEANVLGDIYQVLVERLSEFEARQNDVGLIWGRILAAHEKVVSDLKANGLEALRRLVAHLFETALTEGIVQGPRGAGDLRSIEATRHHSANIILNRFYRLAEAVGVANVRNPEQNQCEITVQDLDNLFDLIRRRVGFDLSPPKVNGGLFGLRIGGNVLNERHFDGIYSAWRIKQLLAERCREMVPVCEIGGGAGFLAHYARRAGIRDYCIIDFPTVGIVQYVVLACEFGASQVHFGPSVKDISLISANCFARDLDFSRFGIVVNADSLPEMPAPVARGYLEAAAHSGALLSINQESSAQHTIDQVVFRQGVVRELCNGLLRPVYRFPSWLRMGYVEELFEPIASTLHRPLQS